MKMRLRELLEELRQVSVWTSATRKTYQYCVDVVCREFESNDPFVDEITVEWISLYRARCLESVSPYTFNSRRSHLAALWKYGMSRGWLAVNVWRVVRPAPLPKRPKALPKDALAQYIEVLQTAKANRKDGTEIDAFPPQFFWLAVVRKRPANAG